MVVTYTWSSPSLESCSRTSSTRLSGRIVPGALIITRSTGVSSANAKALGCRAPSRTPAELTTATGRSPESSCRAS